MNKRKFSNLLSVTLAAMVAQGCSSDFSVKKNSFLAQNPIFAKNYASTASQARGPSALSNDADGVIPTLPGNGANGVVPTTPSFDPNRLPVVPPPGGNPSYPPPAVPTTPGAPSLSPTPGPGTGMIPPAAPVALPPMEEPGFGICSSAVSDWNVRSVTDMHLRFLDSAGQAACVYRSPDLQSRLSTERVLSIHDLSAKCPSLQPGTYRLELRGAQGRIPLQASNYDEIRASFTDRDGTPGNIAWYRVANDIGAEGAASVGKSYTPDPSRAPRYYSVTVSRDGTNQLVARPSAEMNGYRPLVLLDFRVDAAWNAVRYTDDPANDASMKGCSFSGSPLIVQIHGTAEQHERVDLSAPRFGQYFDVLGENSAPYKHAKMLISWFTSKSATRNYFIALPNAQGEVNGVDELFGDNTKGPDGKFAANGYAALRKYDRNGDGFISKIDPVFSRLKLWAGENRNAIAEPSELHSLDELKVDMIDLHFDSSFREVDQYGNEVKMKSVARTKDGKLHAVYDLWFALPSALNAR